MKRFGPSPKGPWGVLCGLAALLMLAAIYAALLYAPTEAQMGDVQRIFYFHVPAAGVALLAFFIVFVASILYLRTRKARWDIVACSSAEIGVVFTTLALITGSLWARPIWGAWWTWDPRLTTTLVLWLIYIVYLILRRAVADPGRRAAVAAVFGIVGFVDVPIVFMSIRWWRSMHPVLFTRESLGLSPEMLYALLISLAAFTLLYFCLLRVRYGVEQAEADLAALRASLSEEGR